MIIRAESPSDAPRIHALTQAAFLKAAHAAHTEHFIVDALRSAGALSVSLVVDDDGVLVGHVAASPVTVSDGARGWYGIGPLSVVPERQRQGVGSALMVEALRQLEARGASGCVLVGSPAYYARFGFSHPQGLGLPDIPPEYFLARPLGQLVPQGAVTFHAAFQVKG